MRSSSVAPSASGFTPTRARQRGATLLESLVAFVLLGLGTAAVVESQSVLRLHADLARQRSEAIRLGQREIERLRAYSTIASSATASSYAGIVDAESVFDAGSGDIANTAYRLVRRVDDAAIAGAKAVRVGIEWADRRGQVQRASLETLIARADPLYSGALAIGTGSSAARGAFGRSLAIPATAHSLGDGRSAWRPAAASSVVLVFDDASGQVVSQCSSVTAAMPDLVAGDLAGCRAGRWLLLSGTVRFSSATPPVAAAANEPPLPLAVSLVLAGDHGDSEPSCTVEAMKTVRRSDDRGLHLDAVDLDATPPAEGIAAWEDTGERYAAYRCLVSPGASGRWSGRSTLVPLGWRLGTGAGDRRVCRFAADRDGSGAVDANIEHPAEYHDVNASLSGQNFLVVRGDQDCPIAAAGDPFPDANQTVPHQP